MSQLLSEWLNKEIKLSQAIKSSDMDSIFRSGFLFGELLSHFNLQKDFSTFSSSRSTDAWISNYIKLEPTLRSLGIPFHAQIVRDLMQGKSGTAAKLLYQLKITLPKLQQQTAAILAKSNYSFSDKRGSPESRSYPSTPKAHIASGANGNKQQGNIIIPKNPRTTAHDQREHEFFVDNLKSKTKRIDHDLEEIALKYQQFQVDQEARKMKMMEEKKARVLEEKLERLQKIREGDRHRSKLQRSEITYGSIPKTQVELTKIAMAKLKEEKSRKRVELSKKFSFQNYRSEVEMFERTNMISLAEDNELDNLDTAVQNIINEEKTSKSIRSSADSNSKEDSLLKNHRVNAEEEEETVILREKKLLSKINQNQNERFKESEEDQLFVRLIHESEDERKLAAEISAVRREKEIIIRNRLFREQQYQEQREKDMKDSWNREVTISQQVDSQFKKDAETVLLQHMNILDEKSRKRREKDVEFCRNVVHQIVDMSMKIGEYRLLGDGYVPSNYYQKWKKLFISGLSIDKEYELPVQDDKVNLPTIQDLPPTTEAPTSTNEVEAGHQANELVDKASMIYRGVRLLDEDEFQDFFHVSGQWGNNESAYQNNPALSKLIDTILKTNTIAGPARKESKFPSVPLKLAIIGKQLSGKTTIAKIIADNLRLRHITVEGTVQSFIKKYSNNNNESPELTELAKNSLNCLSKGLKLEESLLISIMTHAIKEANDLVSQKQIIGYILDDFPRTRNQAQMIEKELTGYEEPKTIKPGNLKRGLKPPLKERRKSVIAFQPGLDAEATMLSNTPSFIDGVLLLQAPNAVVVERSSGRRFDPLTGAVYHLQYNPPPKIEAGLMDRLVPLTEDELNQMQFQLNIFEEQEDQLIDWFSRFQNIKVIDASLNEIASVVTEAETEIRKIQEKKERDKILEEEMKDASTKQPEVAVSSGSQQSSAPNPRPATAGSINGGANQEQTQQQTQSRPVTAGTKSTDQVSPVSLPCAEMLADKWASMENNYIDTLKFIFRSLRREKDTMIKYLFHVKQEFKSFLTRPDSKQELLEDFQSKYNAFDNDFRSDPECKAEWHQRASDLQDKLWDLTEKRKEEGEQERVAIATNRWMEDHIVFVTNFYILVLQLELDRHHVTLNVVSDYYRDIERKALIAPGIIQTVSLPLASISEDQQQPTADDKKVQQTPAVVGGSSAANTAKKAVVAKVPSVTGKKLATDANGENSPEILNFFQYFQTAFNQGISTISSQIPGGIDEFTRSLELSPESTSEITEILKIEEQVSRSRLESIRDHVFQSIKEIYLKCQESFSILDEWNVQRYHAEMAAIRDLIFVIRDVIEVEIQMTNEFVLMGDKFHVDLQALTMEPESEPEPPAPKEKTYPDQFTIFQLQNIVSRFKDSFGSGFVPIKDFIEYILKQAALSTGVELIPDQLIQMEYSAFCQYFANQDPFDSGFLNWKRFVLMHARILPAPENTLVNLKKTLSDLDKSGFISKDSFMKTPLWFETGSNDNGFNRTLKLKVALYEMFEKNVILEGSDTKVFDYKDFLSHLVWDYNYSLAIRKALIISNQDEGLDVDFETVKRVFCSLVQLSPDSMRDESPQSSAFFEPIIDNLKTIFAACHVESMENESPDREEVVPEVESTTFSKKRIPIEDFVDAYETQTLAVNSMFMIDDLLKN